LVATKGTFNSAKRTGAWRHHRYNTSLPLGKGSAGFAGNPAHDAKDEFEFKIGCDFVRRDNDKDKNLRHAGKHPAWI
jgi:hypothetical protein